MQFGRNTGEVGEARVPLHEAELRVHHVDAVGHAGEGGFQVLRLGVGFGLRDLQLGVGRGQGGMIGGLALAAGSGEVGVVQDQPAHHQQQHDDAPGVAGGLPLPQGRRLHRVLLVHGDDQHQIAFGQLAEGMNAAHGVGCGVADPNAVWGTLRGQDHGRARHVGVRTGVGGAQAGPYPAIPRADHGDQPVGADEGLFEHVHKRGNPVIGGDRTAEAAIGPVQPYRHVQVPLAHDRIERGGPDEHAAARGRLPASVDHEVPRGDVLADRFGHRCLADDPVFVHPNQVAADPAEDQRVGPALFQLEMRRIGLPRTRQELQGLIDRQQLALDLLGQDRRLIAEQHFRPRLGFHPLSADGRVGNRPGYRDRAEDEQDSDGAPERVLVRVQRAPAAAQRDNDATGARRTAHEALVYRGMVRDFDREAWSLAEGDGEGKYGLRAC